MSLQSRGPIAGKVEPGQHDKTFYENKGLLCGWPGKGGAAEDCAAGSSGCELCCLAGIPRTETSCQTCGIKYTDSKRKAYIEKAKKR